MLAPRIRADLQAGFMVMITGSKFAASSAIAGNHLLPSEIVDQLGSLDRRRVCSRVCVGRRLACRLAQKDQCQFAVTGMGAGLRLGGGLGELEKLFTLPVHFAMPSLRRCKCGRTARSRNSVLN